MFLSSYTLYELCCGFMCIPRLWIAFLCPGVSMGNASASQVPWAGRGRTKPVFPLCWDRTPVMPAHHLITKLEGGWGAFALSPCANLLWLNRDPRLRVCPFYKTAELFDSGHFRCISCLCFWRFWQQCHLLIHLQLNHVLAFLQFQAFFSGLLN